MLPVDPDILANFKAHLETHQAFNSFVYDVVQRYERAKDGRTVEDLDRYAGWGFRDGSIFVYYQEKGAFETTYEEGWDVPLAVFFDDQIIERLDQERQVREAMRRREEEKRQERLAQEKDLRDVQELQRLATKLGKRVIDG